MLFACPHCQMSLQSEDSMAGQTVSCPGCGTRLQIPADRPQVSGSAPAAGGHRKRGGWPETDPANVHVWHSLGLGAAGMLVTVGLLYTVRTTFVGQIFFSGGWVNYAEFLLFFWGLGILFLKNQKTKHQRAAMLLDVLPKRLGDQINAANVGTFIDGLYRLPERLRDSMMVNRIRKALELFEARTNNGEVATLMEAQSGVDANRIAGSYALLKVFLWAIPILGFIGTVLGLSFAMAGFGSADLTDMEAMKTAVGTITGGLATAFNTTLLGLILSMLLIFPMSAMQKREEDCLNDIDAFCNESVLPRLNDGGSSDAKLNELVSNPAAFAQMLSDFVTAQQQLVEDLRTVSSAVNEAVGHLESRANTHQLRVESQLSAAVEGLTAQTAQAFNSSSMAVEKYIGGLALGIDALNKTLSNLGEKQVVLNVPPQRRGWLFGRSN